MKYDHRDNSGQLFRIPPEKMKSEKSFQYEGEYKIGCPSCGSFHNGWVKAWVKTAKNGAKFFSLAFKAKGKAAAGERE